MANNCYNYIDIEGINEEISDKIEKWVEDYPHYDHINEWVHSIISEKNGLPEEPHRAYTYGGRWFDVEAEPHMGESIGLRGDSAWSPMTGLCKVLSAEFQCKVSISWEEPGNDLGGSAEYYKGKTIREEEVGYLKHQFNEWGIDAIYNESESSIEGENEESFQDFMKILLDAEIPYGKEDVLEFRRRTNNELTIVKY